jgi:hypothetical protein
MKKFKRRSAKNPWHAVGPALGMLALFVALGGTANALVGSNTVDADDLDVGTVASREILNNSIKAKDIDAGAIKDAELGTIVVRTATNALADGASGRAEAVCNAGERLIGGGGSTQQSGSDAIFHGSHPSIGGGIAPVAGVTPTAWNAKATNAVGGSGLLTVDVNAYALCLQ